MKADKDFSYCRTVLVYLEKLYYLKTIELDLNASLRVICRKKKVHNFSLMGYLKISFALLIFKAFLDIPNVQFIF
jgi:hypothetical protein